MESAHRTCCSWVPLLWAHVTTVIFNHAHCLDLSSGQTWVLIWRHWDVWTTWSSPWRGCVQRAEGKASEGWGPSPQNTTVSLSEPTMWATFFLLRERIALFQTLSAMVRLVANFFSEAPCPRPCRSWREQATWPCGQCLIEHETYPLGSCQHFQGSCSPKSLAGRPGPEDP